MDKIMAGIAAIAALTLQAAPGIAATSPALQGVWQGTLGSQPVRVCFNQRDGDNFGAYYYQSHLQAIALQQSNDSERTYIEGLENDDAKAPRWTLDGVGAATLTGHWTQSARNLPIKLSRVPGPKLKEDETPCGSMLFQGPRLEGLRTVSKPAIIQGVHYTRLILDNRGHFGDDVTVETFALDGSTPAIQRINAALHEPLTGEKTGWLACIRQAWDNSPNGGATSETLSPRLITHKWLTVMDEDGWDCGGAHPDDANVPRLFDLETGAEIDPLDWLNDKAVKREWFKDLKEEAKTLRPAFLTFLLTGWKPKDEECGEPVRTQEFWHVELTRTGFSFTPDLAHVAEPCIEGFKVPFAKLGPWLSAEGQKEVVAFQAEIAAKR